MVRLFKPGDRVQLKTGGPTMIVMNYVLKHKPWVGTYLSNNEVECAWYVKGQRKSDIFHQNALVLKSGNTRHFPTTESKENQAALRQQQI